MTPAPFLNIFDLNVGSTMDAVQKFVQTHQNGIAIAITSVAGIILLKIYLKGGQCRSKAKLTGKTPLITGCNTGIGKETARDFAKRGGRVLVACRDLQKAEAAAEEIRDSTGNKDVVVYKLDLSSLASVRESAAEVNKKEERLDILVNNAGAGLTTYSPPIYISGTGVTTNSLHPVAISSDLPRHRTQLPFYYRWPLAIFYHTVFKPMVKNVRDGAQTTIYGSVSEDVAGITGKYFSDCALKETSVGGRDDEAAAKLWEVSEKMTGIK